MKIDESLRRSVRLLLFLVMAVQVHYSSWITPDPLSPMASSWFLPGRIQDFAPPARLHWATPWGACYARKSSGHYWTKEALRFVTFCLPWTWLPILTPWYSTGCDRVNHSQTWCQPSQPDREGCYWTRMVSWCYPVCHAILPLHCDDRKNTMKGNRSVSPRLPITHGFLSPRIPPKNSALKTLDKLWWNVIPITLGELNITLNTMPIRSF